MSTIRARSTVAAAVFFAALCVPLVLVACTGGASAPPTPAPGGAPFGLPPGGQVQGLLYSVPCYTAQGGASVVASSGCTISIDGGVLEFTTSGELEGHVIYATSTPATVVTGTALAPGAVMQPISIATAGTVPLTIPSAGVQFCVWNTGSQAVTIADSGNQVLAGNFAMGQYDVLCMFSDGTRLIERSRSNN